MTGKREHWFALFSFFFLCEQEPWSLLGLHFCFKQTYYLVSWRKVGRERIATFTACTNIITIPLVCFHIEIMMTYASCLILIALDASLSFLFLLISFFFKCLTWSVESYTLKKSVGMPLFDALGFSSRGLMSFSTHFVIHWKTIHVGGSLAGPVGLGTGILCLSTHTNQITQKGEPQDEIGWFNMQHDILIHSYCVYEQLYASNGDIGFKRIISMIILTRKLINHWQLSKKPHQKLKSSYFIITIMKRHCFP